MTKYGLTWSASKRWNQGAIGQSQRWLQAATREGSSRKQMPTSRSLYSSASPRATLPATQAPMAGWVLAEEREHRFEHAPMVGQLLDVLVDGFVYSGHAHL